ncbi:hypothetical protein PBRA_005978 [Plasmodiophora brassicae]|uniref:AAA+ ATPase domain-containing protein n=1 Tax=Plasmodiophora brassicae TaxID=37360 RepID=A0A0G4IRT7_PLABS|nr:hypothetical protein PBRA_005978 [Plasmodiophora brassicae]
MVRHRSDRRGRLEGELYARVAEWFEVAQEDAANDDSPSPTCDDAIAYLCERFPAYARLKPAPFSKAVADVWNTLTGNTGGKRALSDDAQDDCAMLDVVDPVDYRDTNAVNASMRSVYGKAASGRKRAKVASPAAAASYVVQSASSYADVGGLDDVLQQLREIVEPALLHPEIFEHLGIRPPSGVLLHGPPGTGKTLLAHAIAGELDVPFLSVSGPELVAGVSGESESKIRALFGEAARLAPCVVFIDEVDSITPKRDQVGKDMERRIVAQLLTSMATLSASSTRPVIPSAKREGFATTPDVTWDDIGALDRLRDDLRLAIVLPITRPALFASFALDVATGVLLYGPPGCGKTLVAKAVANDSGASFISIKGPELLNKFVGESERAVRQVFERARASAPSVIFFDELDALCPRRGTGRSSGEGVSERVVNTLLTEMDGLDTRRNVFVVAATNRPDMIDPAMLRPGRLDKILYVPLPSASDRAAILSRHLRRVPLDANVNVADIAADARCDGFSGADLASLAREASLCALKAYLSVHPDVDRFDGTAVVARAHFDDALDRIQPSVSEGSRRRYDRMQQVLRRSRAELHTTDDGKPAAAAAAAAADDDHQL